MQDVGVNWPLDPFKLVNPGFCSRKEVLYRAIHIFCNKDFSRLGRPLKSGGQIYDRSDGREIFAKFTHFPDGDIACMNPHTNADRKFLPFLTLDA